MENLALFVIMLICVATTIGTTNEKLHDKNDLFRCDSISSVPVWSWALSRTCCDVFPLRGEERVMADPNYFLQKDIVKNNSIIYVFIQDLPIFVNLVFTHLPNDYRVTLVTGMDDFGAPFEIFSPSGRFKVKPPISMRQFLMDPRLNRWYAQNYDLVGCNGLSKLCSDVKKKEEPFFTSKVFPIPIGLDLHTFAGKGDMSSEYFMQKSCDQRKEIENLKKRSTSLKDRDLSIVAAFDCSKTQRMKSVRRFELRRELCSLIHDHTTPSTKKQPIHMIFGSISSLFTSSTITPKSNEEFLSPNSSSSVQVRVVVGEGAAARGNFWQHIALNSSFALAPFGRGLDTHRVWEVLQLGGIPIVLSSSLDRLYEKFPVLIVHSWKEVFVSQAYLQKRKDEIVAKFGSPFNSDVQRRLTLDYWVNFIKTGFE